MYSIAGQYQDSDFKATVRLHFRIRPAITVLWIAVTAAAALVVVLSIPRSPTWIGGIVTSVVLMATLINQYVVAPKRTLSAFRKNQVLSSPFKMEIDETTFTQINDFGSGQLKWDIFLKWKADENILILYQNKALIYILPLRLIPSESERSTLKDLVRGKIGNITPKSARTRMFWIIILAVMVASFLFFYFFK